jgi:molybdate transport system ATP-binding protein
VKLDVDFSVTVGAFRLAVHFTTSAGITALFGPSGAGKTLTLRCIAGLTNPAAGRIVIGDHPLFDSAAGIDLSPRSRNVGLLFQQYALFPHLSVERNIAFGIHHLPRDRRRERVSELLQLVGLDGFHTRRPAQLSGGQQQRVALARALAPRPRLLLLDEPFSAVDFRVRRRLRAELLRIHNATGTPMLLVTHDLAEVRHLSDSLVLLDQGSVLQAGPTAEVLREPASPQAEDLLSE